MSTARAVLGGGVLSEFHATRTLVNDTTATDIFGGLITIPAKVLQAGDVLQLTASGTRLNNSGSNVNYTIPIKLGATTIAGTGVVAVATNANPMLWTLDMLIHIESATAQRIATRFMNGGPTNGTLGALSTTNCMVGAAIAADDTSSAKTITMTVTLGTAAATINFVCNQAALVLQRESPFAP